MVHCVIHDLDEISRKVFFVGRVLNCLSSSNHVMEFVAISQRHTLSDKSGIKLRNITDSSVTFVQSSLNHLCALQ